MSKTLKINREADCIGKYTFGATDVEIVIIPSTVSNIAPDTFSDCTRLKNIYCEFGKDSIPGAPWGAPATCKIYYRVYYENPVQESNKSGVGGVDVSGVTARPGDVLAGKKFVDAAGNLLAGSMQDVTASLTGNIVWVPAGHIAETQVLTVPEAAEPTVSGNVVTVNAGYQAAQKQVAVGTALVAKTYTPGTSDQTIAAGQYLSGKQTIKGDTNLASANIRAGKSIFGKAGSFTADATATAEDIAAGKTAGINGEMVTGTLEIGGGGAEMQFYLCMSYEGVVEKIIVTAGAITDEMEEPVSLIGEYTIVDPTAVGTDRRWYCAQTTASGDYPAYTSGVTIGCVGIDTGNYDENDNIIYEKYWAFAPGTDIDEWSYWLSSQTEGLESPFMVQDWRGYGGTIVTAPVLTSNVEDVAPYAPTGWSGRPIVMTDNPVLFSYGAGLKNANGFWEQIAGDGLTIESKWQLIGTDSIIEDGNSANNEIDSYHFWRLCGIYPGNPWGQLYNNAGGNWMIGDIKHPGLCSWSSVSSLFDPPPTFVYSETGGYFPSDTVVSGLTYAGKPPEIGGFYNADATIKADRFFPA